MATPPATTGAPRWLATPELEADLVDEGETPPLFGPVLLLEVLEEPPERETPLGDEVALALGNPTLSLVLVPCKSCDKADDSRPLSELSVGEEPDFDICKTFELEPDPRKV